MAKKKRTTAKTQTQAKPMENPSKTTKKSSASKKSTKKTATDPKVKLWSRFREFDNGRFFKLRDYDDYMEVAIHSVGGGVDAEIYVDNKIDDDDSDKKSNENNMQIVLSSIGCSSRGKFDDGEYESEELHSSDPDASDEERGLRYEKYRKEKMGKKDKFKCGMEFNSLKDFRFAIRDHNVRNGYDIKFVKNEGDRRIGVDRPIPSIHPRFSSFYFCFEGCKKGFTNGCRPFIGVDGCHLKTKYGGQLLIAVGRDPHDQYFPLAFGVVENETKESWRWFIQLLMEDLGTDNKYVFISDQQKGLVAVFDEMFDRIEHRLCLRHLYANFKKKFGGGAMIRDLMMGAAKATCVQAWEQKMEELKKIDKQAWEWLVKVPTKYWCKHAFGFYSKCDVLMNNFSESFNATILVARDKPILTLCEWIRNYLMNRMMTCVTKLERWEHRMMPMKRLEKEIVMADTLHPTLSSAGEIWQVSHQYKGQQFIVDTLKKTCSCNFWELVGIPCRHAVAPLGYRFQDPIDFMDNYYSREKYASCYGFGVSPINGADMWPKPPEGVDENILPPMYKNGPGRPRKLRIRAVGEEDARKRRRGVYHCTTCNNTSHNAKSCKATEQDPNSLKRKRKNTKGKGKAKNESKQATQAPVADAPEGSQNQATQEPPDATQAPPAATQAPPAAIPTLAPKSTQSEAPEAVEASQVSMVVEPSQDLFDDIPDDIIASLPDVDMANKIEPANQKRKKINVKTEKVKKIADIYHGKPRRSSERVKQNCFKTPITGVGTSQEQPIEIKEADDGDLINDDAKLGTCFRSMKSWKDIPKKNNK
ncbi:hypothetical protein QL285_009897 [Trifolium repens]|nr:hypothetical protein QL285_009897 [Trifolium repens]